MSAQARSRKSKIRDQKSRSSAFYGRLVMLSGAKHLGLLLWRAGPKKIRDSSLRSE